MFTTETFLHDWTGETATPLQLVSNHVKPQWVDEYGHLNMAHYLSICDQANWAFWNWINHPHQAIDPRNGHEYIIVENHITYTGELTENDPFTIETLLLDRDDKRLILCHCVLDTNGNTAATNETKWLGFNLNSRRPETWQATVSKRLSEIHHTHAQATRPPNLGQGIMLKRK